VQVRAYKRISIDDAPNVLTVHLKRFDFFGRGHKVSKRVEFGLELDLGPYMTQHLQRQHHPKHHKQQQQQHGQQNGLHAHHQQQQQQQHLHQQQHGPHHHHGHHQPLMYDLYAVLVHLGHSLHSGHYVCYVKAGNGIWHICDDHRVAQVSQRVVESQQAYILFYVKRQPKGAAAAAQNAAVAANRLQQQKQQQPLGASDSTKTPLAGAAAAGQARLVSAAAAAAGLGQQQQQRGAAARLPAGQSGSLSAAEGVRKVATSSTESTANASPGGTPVG
jgi:ubiquitin carboxyl-terminal hydrolase 36/42